MPFCAARAARGPPITARAEAHPPPPPKAAATADAADGTGGARRAELELLRVSEIKRKAAAAGILQAALDSADDSGHPKAAVIALIIAMEGEVGGVRNTAWQDLPAADQKRLFLLREELALLRVSQAKREAVARGATQLELDNVDDSNAPKAALINWIIAKEVSAGVAPAPAPAPAMPELEDGHKVPPFSHVIHEGEPPSSDDEGGGGGGGHSAEDAELEALRAELGSLKLSAIKKRAVAMGIMMQTLDDIVDNSDTPHPEIIALLLERHNSAARSGATTAGPSPGPPVTTAGLPAKGHQHGKAALPAPPSTPSGAGRGLVSTTVPDTKALRSELSGMKMSALRKRATAEGVDKDAFERAVDDAADPRGSVVELILAAVTGARAPAGANDVLVAELEGSKMSALRKRAVGLGVDAVLLETAIDSDAPRAAVIALIVQAS